MSATASAAERALALVKAAPWLDLPTVINTLVEHDKKEEYKRMLNEPTSPSTVDQTQFFLFFQAETVRDVLRCFTWLSGRANELAGEDTPIAALQCSRAGMLVRAASFWVTGIFASSYGESLFVSLLYQNASGIAAALRIASYELDDETGEFGQLVWFAEQFAFHVAAMRVGDFTVREETLRAGAEWARLAATS